MDTCLSPCCSYMMSNGYKPSPLDLSDIKLTPGQELLVDKLAENAHNVWAKDRIKQGWTYGIQQVVQAHVCIQGVAAAVSNVLLVCQHNIEFSYETRL